MVKVIPTILTGEKKEFEERFEKLKFADIIQIDFMDGKFVKNKSLPIGEMPVFKRRVEAHLMVENPEEYVEDLIRRGFKKIIFHYESFKDKNSIREFAKKLTSQGLKPVLAINPKTEIKDVYELIGSFTTILFLGVEPGKEEQEFQTGIIKKIKELKEYDPNIVIQVDGGVNQETAKHLKGLVDIVNSGSYISKSENPLEAFNELREVLN